MMPCVIDPTIPLFHLSISECGKYHMIKFYDAVLNCINP